MQKNPQAPAAPVRPHVRELHGERFVDDYFWLREKTNPAVRAYLEEENTYTAAWMEPLNPLQDALYREMVARIQETDETAPARKGAWAYFQRTEKGKEYPIHCRKPAGAGAPQVIVDVNELARGEKFMSVPAREVSDDGLLLAYLADNTGFRQYRLRVKDLATGGMLPDTAERVTSVGWAADNRTLFFTTEDPVTKRSDKLFRLQLGGKPELVYEETDEHFDIGVGRTRDGRFLAMESHSHTATEWRLLPATTPRANWRLVQARRPDHEYYLDSHEDQLLIWSNRAGRNFALFSAPAESPDEEHWRELIPHRPEVKIEAVHSFSNHYVVEERANGLVQFQVVRFSDSARHEIKFPEPSYTARADSNLEFDTRMFRFRYESPKTPDSIYDHEMNTGEDVLRKREPVLGGFDPAAYEVERLWARAPDGVSVPLTVLSRKGMPRSKPAPLLLYGYGAYGYPLDAIFSSTILSLVDRGVVYAMAHVRGGGDLGKPWHDAGRMANKMNTFTDFIACAEHLIRERRTAPDRLAVSGGSAGGLLMGAVVNLRPDLFRAVLSHVPFVDVISSMNDETLPLTVAEYEEWGNPKLPDQYKWLRAYCPYTNLDREAYPSMLVKTSFNDSQVMYWEPAKYVARLRTLNTGTRPILLHVNMAAGHGGASGRYERFKEIAFDYAYLLHEMGVR